MKGYKSEAIRNVAVLGHSACGKTTFLEAALLSTGVINRLGKVEDGNTVSDYDKMEIEKKYSISTTPVPVEHKKVKINFLDTPGFFDFVGDVYSALTAADSAIILVDAASGIEVGTEKAWALCEKFDKPRIFVINKIDKENVNIAQVVQSLKDKFGTSVVTLDDKAALNEAVAEMDEALLDKYFSGEEFTPEEFNNGLLTGIKTSQITPIIPMSAISGEGVSDVLDSIVDFMPNPLQGNPRGAIKGGQAVDVSVSANDKTALFVFKTIADPFLGKISFVKVVGGSLRSGAELYNPRAEKSEKMGALFFMRGKSQVESGDIAAGDIAAAAKLQFTKTGDTLCEKGSDIVFECIQFPKPSLYFAIAPKAKGDEEKVSAGLHKLMEEDPSLVTERNSETHQMLIGGQGDIQLNIIIAKLKERYGVEVEQIPQKIAYRETIKGNSDVQGKHKKQTGGAGQYGDVHIRFSPSAQEFEFSEELFGGSVPKNYVPAVEKGLLECMNKGPLAGCKVVNVKAVLYDGSYHDVDSNEMAFKVAASLAFRKGIVEANPCLLEPIMKMEIFVPDDYMGDVMGDMNGSRRGKILGMEPQMDGSQKLMAEAPQAEIFDYAIALRSMTHARGSFTMEFDRYDEVPAHLAAKIIADHKAEEEADGK